MVIFWVSGVFWSFLGFGGMLVIFLGFRGILVFFWVSGPTLVIFFGFQEYFGHFLGFLVFGSFFRFRKYFGHFLGFWGILVNFWVSELFW